MFKKVLVPLDGSELADGILPFITSVASALDTQMLLVSVLGPEPHRAGGPDAASVAAPWSGGQLGPAVAVGNRARQTHRAQVAGPPQVNELTVATAQAHLESAAERLAEEGVRSQWTITSGSPAEEIVRVAASEGCDLIAMSTHGRGALGRSVLGSVTDKVIRTSNLPTLTITPERANALWREGVAISKVIVPLDGSALAETALPVVEWLARALSLKVVLARVARVGGFYSTGTYHYPYVDQHNLDIEFETDAFEYLQGVAGRLKEKGLDVELKLLRGAAANALVELAWETQHDMIVMTTHGRSGLTRWVLGSVTEALIRASGDPVLVLPPNRV